MLQETSTFTKLIQEREVIRANINRIEDLSQDLVNLGALQKDSRDITPHQYNFINAKRVNLRYNIVDLKDGLRIHFDLREKVLKPLVNFSLLQTLVTKYKKIIEKLSEVEIVILKLSPLGILFNSHYLKGMIRDIFQVLHNLTY